MVLKEYITSLAPDVVADVHTSAIPFLDDYTCNGTWTRDPEPDETMENLFDRCLNRLWTMDRQWT